MFVLYVQDRLEGITVILYKVWDIVTLAKQQVYRAGKVMLGWFCTPVKSKLYDTSKYSNAEMQLHYSTAQYNSFQYSMVRLAP